MLGKSKNSCNSISVGAFLDDDDDDEMSLEEVKNRQNAARNSSRAVASNEPTINDLGNSECDILSIDHTESMKQMADVANRHEKAVPTSKNGFCTVVNDRTIAPPKKQGQEGEECLLLPVSNLMEEFDKLSCQDPGECSSGKPSQPTVESGNEIVELGSSKQVRKFLDNQDKMCSLLPKAGGAVGKTENTTVRIEEKMPLEVGKCLVEISALSGEKDQLYNSESQPELQKTRFSNWREKKSFLSGYGVLVLAVNCTTEVCHIWGVLIHYMYRANICFEKILTYSNELYHSISLLYIPKLFHM